MTRGRGLTAGLGVLVLLAGCTDSPGTPSAGPTAGPPGGGPAVGNSGSTGPAAGGASGGVSGGVSGGPAETRTVDAAGDILDMGMLPLTRVGGTVVVSISTRVQRPKSGAGSSLVTGHFSTVLAGSFDNVRLVDTQARRVYAVAPGADGSRCVCTGSARVAAGESRTLSAAFGGVPASVTTLSVMLPYAGVFADVPVVPGSAPPNPDVDLGNVGTSPAADLDAYSERLDVGLTTRRTPGRVDLSLDADVLFRLDSASLTAAAGKVVTAAAADIRAAGPGPLTITGHTDITSSAEHNQGLSERRAATVATALSKQLPNDRWPKSVTGKGETQPAFPNDTADHRRRNRRVTITYRPTPPPPTTTSPSPRMSPGTGIPAQPNVKLPKTTGIQAQGAQGAEVALPLRRGTIRFTAATATRRGPFVQVDLLAHNVGERNATILSYLGQGAFTVRDELDPYAPYGASGVRMFAAATTYYNLDYTTADHGHRCLCDRLLNTAIPPASTQTIALWYPAPPLGTTTITLDVPNAFRLTNIPV